MPQRGAAPVVQRDYQPEYQFPGRWQVSVGVGETVKLSVTNPNAGSLKWTDESPLPVGVLGATAPSGEAASAGELGPCGVFVVGGGELVVQVGGP